MLSSFALAALEPSFFTTFLHSADSEAHRSNINKTVFLSLEGAFVTC